jgi:3-hydroxy acid dehydrogenase/malonic semialdehyde reductase
MINPLAGQWVLITGASSGFGAAAARAFGAAGARLLLGARRHERLARVAEEALQAGAPQARFQTLDVAQTASVDAFVAWLRGITDRVQVLINNAGGAHGLDTIVAGKDGDWEAMVQSNVLGLLRVTRAVLPLMQGQPGATILNIGSVAGHEAYAGGAAYCGCKAAERQITRALRLELCGMGIRVGTVDPGLAETEFSLVRFKGDQAQAHKVYEGLQPLMAEDVAETLVWVATRPPHVCIDEVIIKPTDQAAVHKIHRRPPA